MIDMSQMVQSLALAALKLHPRNEEFFSNAEGEDFKRLKESIAEQGILTPLRVSSDMVIVSGHQRYRAAKELEMTHVPVIVDETLMDEDEKLAQLIASNFGRMKNDPVKQGRWIKEYERLKGVRHGGDRKSRPQNAVLITQEMIAKELNISVDTVQRLKKLDDIAPGFKKIISEGRITATTGSDLIAQLSEEEQQQLIEKIKDLPEVKKFTRKQIEEHIKSIKDENANAGSSKDSEEKEVEDEVKELEKELVLAMKAVKASKDAQLFMDGQKKMQAAIENQRVADTENRNLKKQIATNKTTINKLQRDLEAAQNRANITPDVIEREVEVEVKVYPDDYEELKAKAAKYDKFVEMNIQSRDIESLNSPEEQQQQYELWFMQEIEGFVPEFRGLLLDAERIRGMSDTDRMNYKESLEEIIQIATAMLDIINEKKEVA